MDVILTEKVGKLGNLGDKVTVKPGFGRNFLIPYGKAVFATEQNLVDFERRRADLEIAAADKLAIAQRLADSLAALGTVTITAVAGDEGKLFGSVGPRDIAEACLALGVELSKSYINMPDGAIRELGEYSVNVQPHHDVQLEVQIIVDKE
jgi:large subunit ribosomal protein L9